jgi:DNA-directed RNA polymerase I, II, and III subunit RPABC1
MTESNILVPKHTKLSDAEKKALFDLHGITFIALPKIQKSDAAIAELDAKEGDVIKIVRPSATAGKSVFYRGVLNE